MSVSAVEREGRGTVEGAETTTSSREENERRRSAVPLLMLSLSGVCAVFNMLEEQSQRSDSSKLQTATEMMNHKSLT